MKDKMGDALKKVVSEESSESIDEGLVSSITLLNPNRLEIFQYVCRNPGILPTRLYKELSMARGTVSWHLEKLISKGYVVKKETSIGTAIFPRGVSWKEDEATFRAVLANGGKAVFLAVLESPGSSLAEIISEKKERSKALRHLSYLINSGYIVVMKDGNKNCYFPSAKIESLERSKKEKGRAHLKYILRILKEERIVPEVTPSRTGGTVLRFKVGKKERKLTIL